MILIFMEFIIFGNYIIFKIFFEYLNFLKEIFYFKCKFCLYSYEIFMLFDLESSKI